jgi:hypothetical protein
VKTSNPTMKCLVLLACALLWLLRVVVEELDWREEGKDTYSGKVKVT